MPVPTSSSRRQRQESRSLGRVLGAVAAASMLFLSACDEATAPEGVSAAVDIRVYLDKDGSGSFTAPDSGLAGIALALTPSDGSGATLAATSDNQGVATFAEVAPGSYTITVPDSPPPGMVLSSGQSPRLVVSAIGQVNAQAVRYSWTPGIVSGRIFRDDDASGAWSEGDTPGAGLYALLIKDGSSVDSTVADDEGVFRFPFITPGDYSVSVENPATITYPGGSVQPDLRIVAGVVSDLEFPFTGALVIPVAEARSRPVGTTVAVTGNLVVVPGRFLSGVNSEIWVQDETGGIAAFAIPTADSLNYAAGDLLEITGTRGEFNGQTQLTITRIAKLGTGVAPSPVVQTVELARALERDGQLVRVNSLTVVSIATGTAPAFNVTTVDAKGDTLELRVAGLGTGLDRSSFEVGKTYDATGILTQFRGVAQIKMRDSKDLASGASGSTISDIRNSGTLGTEYSITGKLTSVPGQFPTSGTNTTRSELWIQDESGGIALFSVLTTDSTLYSLGDEVSVKGTLGAFGGQLQLASPSVTRTGPGVPVAPVVLTVDEFNSREAEGRLVTLSGVKITSVAEGTAAAFNVNGEVDGTPVLMRVAGALTGLSRTSFVVGDVYTATGILTQFNGASQLKIRGISDVESGSKISTISQVRSGDDGSRYTVSGRITAEPGQIPTSATNTTNSELWIQDATGGIAVFSVPTADSSRLRLGNTVTVTGTRAAFRGQMQLATSPVVTRTSSGSYVEATHQTIEQIHSLALEGRVISLGGILVKSVESGATAFNVNGEVDGTPIVIRVSGALRGIDRETFKVDSTYSVSGILTQRDGVAQIKVRDANDVIAGTVASISWVRLNGVDATRYSVVGRITAAPGQVMTSGSNTNNSEIWIQDATGGIAVFSLPTADSANYRLGDIVAVNGARGAFGGQLQLTGSPQFRILGTAAPISPKRVSIDEALSLDRSGQLVTLSDFEVKTVQTGTSHSFNVTGEVEGKTIVVRVSGALQGLTRESFVVGDKYTVTGLLTQNNTTVQIKVRLSSDVKP